MMRIRLLLLVIALPLLAQSSVTITLDGAGNFRVMGWSDAARLSASQWPQTFSVQVDAPDVPPLLGSYRLEQNALIFAPQFSVQPGVTYRATLKIPNREPVVQRFAIPKADMTPTTVVERVFPSANLLPENQLKFYIYFSASMSRGEAYNRVHLLDENGKAVVKPFLELTEELWDRDARRFTLLFDPGRVKRDLVPHNEMGAPLEEGKKYTLVIDREWVDADGKLLKADYRKSFSVGPADRKALDESAWRVLAPKPGAADPVAVEFPEPMDQALLEGQLEVFDSVGNFVSGSVQIDRDETRWRFTPNSPWKSGAYSIRVGKILSDLAGNMVDHPFEVDVFETVGQQITRETRALSFTVN